MRELPKNGSLVRFRLEHPPLEGQVYAAGFFVTAGRIWLMITGKETLQILEAEEGEWIRAWAPFSRGSWSPPQDDMTDLLEASEIPKDAWFIWQKNGHPPRFAWSHEEGANGEAMRLARAHPGVSFLVMHAVRKFLVEPGEDGELRTVEPPKPGLRYPATKVVHWPSGPVAACDIHAGQLLVLGEHLGGHIAVTALTEPQECSNCLNEHRGDADAARP